MRVWPVIGVEENDELTWEEILASSKVIGSYNTAKETAGGVDVNKQDATESDGVIGI